jgi:putative ABC transport system permease protein
MRAFMLYRGFSMHGFLQDFRHAARSLQKAPAAAGVAILALALGIGANVSAFICANGVILHPLPFTHLERIETIWESNPKIQLDRANVAPANFLDLETQAHSFEYLAACRSTADTIQSGSTSEMVRVAQVSPAFFSVLSGKPALGRILPLQPVAASESNTVVVSDGFWKSRLGSSPEVIGSRLPLSAGNSIIVGVMPDSFDYPLGTEVWSPLVFTPGEKQQRSVHDLTLLGLLRSAATASQAKAEAASIAARLAAQYPNTNGDRSFNVVPLIDLTDGVTNRFIGIILCAAGFVLLLACANIANLQLARAVNRQKEMAVRTALGASRFQIARLLLAESLLLSTAGGLLGVLLADWNNFYAKQNIPAVAMRIVPGLRTMHTDPNVLIFAFLISIAAGVISSFPAFVHLARGVAGGGLEESLRERTSLSAQHSSGMFRSTLVVFELALALVLLIGAGLMAGTFHRLLTLNQGFDPKNVLSVRVSLPAAAYGDSTRRRVYYERALDSLFSLPGVSSASLYSDLGTARQFAIEGRPLPHSGEPLPTIIPASSRYLESLRIPLLDGRSLSAGDRAQSPYAVVLSKTFAHNYWPRTSAVGHRIKLDPAGDWFTVVGVAADVTDDWFTGEPASRAYVSYAQVVPSSAEIIVRAPADPWAFASAVRARLQQLDPTVPLFDLNTMEQAMAEQRAGVQAAARTMTSYAAIALLLATTGIYAVVSYLVSMRTRDIGVHMALGATRGDVLKMMTRQTGKLIFAGVACGIFLSVLLTRLMAHLLFGVIQLDTNVWFVLTFVLLATASLAAYLPAVRATRIDPVSALRHD